MTETADVHEQVGVLAMTGEADRAVLLGRRLTEEAVRAGDRAGEMMVRHATALALSQLAQHEAALAELAVAADLAGRLGIPTAPAVVSSTAAWALVRAGRPEDGLTALAEAHAVLAAREPERHAVVAAINLAMAATQLGLLDLGERWFGYVSDHLDLLPAGRRRSVYAGAHSVLEYEWALAHEHAGETEAAADRFRACLRRGARMGELSDDPYWQLVSVANLGLCAARLGRPEEAVRLLDGVLDAVDTRTMLITRSAAHAGYAWAALALGDLAACRSHGAEAARVAASLGYLRWEADAHRALGRCAARAGDVAAEQRHVARAADLLEELGWQARLRRLGVTLGLAALPREDGGAGAAAAPARPPGDG